MRKQPLLMFLLASYWTTPVEMTNSSTVCDIAIFSRVLRYEYLEEERKPCDPSFQAEVAQRCQALNKTIFGNFRTLSGECNNIKDGLSRGTPFTKLNQLLAADTDRFKVPTFLLPKPSRFARHHQSQGRNDNHIFYYNVLA